MARIALVSPYRWTTPGGVTRHVAALAQELRRRDHDVLVLAPGGGDVPLGPTVGFRSNGAVSHLAYGPSAILRARAALERFAPEVVHLHEPVAPLVCWDLLGAARAPLVGTFHCFSQRRLPHALGNAAGARRRLNRLHVRIAVSPAAAWTGRRFYGGRYRVIPNGVDVPAAPPPPKRPAPVLRLAFVGQAVERKGLAVLLEALAILRADVPAELVVAGADIAPQPGVDVRGPVCEREKARILRGADLLVAPALGGESFGLVLVEAFAQGTPVVASDIAGPRAVVGDAGVLVAPGDPRALAAALGALARDGPRRRALAAAARERAARFAWPRVADEILEAYADAQRMASAPAGARGRLAAAAGLRSADPQGHAPPRRLPEPDPHAPRLGRPRTRRALLAAGAVAVAAGAGLAAGRGGGDAVLSSLLSSQPAWSALALAAMALSLVARAGAWHAILRAAGLRVGRRDALAATAAGVLMSATLPARLGEPVRALLVARRAGGAREHLPAVAGTLVAQTALNALALAALAVPAAGALGPLPAQVVVLVVAPVALAAAVLLAPALPHVRRAAAGLRVLRAPRAAAAAIALQLAAWALQWLGCWLLLRACGLTGEAGAGAAAAVLLAVNLTALVPATPSNVGVFQAACVAVLAGAYGVATADALAYGIVLQAVELAVAVGMGVPALLREGVTWRQARRHALAAPPPRPAPAPR